MKTYHLETLIDGEWIVMLDGFVSFFSADDTLNGIIRITKSQGKKLGCYRIVRTITETDVVCSKSFNL